MSASEPGNEPNLVATAPTGTAIEVRDGAFWIAGLGDTELRLCLKPGLYTVRFSLPGASEEQIARLVPGRPTEVRPRTEGFSEDADTPEQERSLALIVGSNTFASMRRKPVKAGRAAIIIFVRSIDKNVTSDVARSVELFDSCEQASAALQEEGHVKDADEHWTALQFDVEPGVFRLSFETFERKKVAQTVYAFPSRVTYLLAQYGRGTIVTKSKGKQSLAARRGIDPAGSLVFSLDSGASTRELNISVRTARLLLHFLTRPASRSDEERIRRLTKVCGTDPYFFMFLAANLLRLSEVSDAGLLSALAENMLTDLAGVEGPDLKAMRWKSGSRPLRSGEPIDDPVRFPPLLECCWRWLSELSAVNPGVVADAGLIARAAGANPAFRPWLVVGHDPVPVLEVPFEERLEMAKAGVRKVLASVEGFQKLEAELPEGIFLNNRKALVGLGISDQTISLANTVLGSSREQGSPEILIGKLARETGMPVSTLGPRLAKAAEELDASSFGSGFLAAMTGSKGE